MRIRAPIVLAAIWVWLALPGALAQVPPAGTPDPTVVAAASGSTAPVVREALYQIGPGDVIVVQVYGEESLSGEFPVSPSGDLDFPLLGAVRVSGLTPAEVSAHLRARLTPGYLVNPNVTVSVTTYASQPVQVLGAVCKPGLYFLHGPTTVLQILSIAGGVDQEGVNEVRITHGGENGDTTVLPYERLLTQGTEAIMLEAGDVVFVPQSLVTVMGSVGKPGELAFRDGLTVSRCIAAAGGALPTANLRKVYVLRGEVRMRVNVRRILSGRETDLPLLAGDRVVVNESVF